MSTKKLLLMILVPFLVFTISGCVSTKKYKKLETDYQALKKGYDDTNLQLDEKDRQIQELEKILEEQKSIFVSGSR
jgi:outer membrane murein-binding lipoprotein Lpp